MELGLPQWLSLTDAEDVVAKHVAREIEKEEAIQNEEANAQNEYRNGDLGDDHLSEDVCKVPISVNPESLRKGLELELDLDCWKVCPSFCNNDNTGPHDIVLYCSDWRTDCH